MSNINQQRDKIYFIFCVGIMVVIILSELIAQQFIEDHMYSSDVIQLAINQRMTSQKIAKYAWKIKTHRQVISGEDHDNLHELTVLWERYHKLLVNDKGKSGHKHENSLPIQKLYAQKEPHFSAILNSSLALLQTNDSTQIHQNIENILHHEYDFLVVSDKIVKQYKKENHKKLRQLKLISIITASLAILTLGTIGYISYKRQQNKSKELQILNLELRKGNKNITAANDELTYLNKELNQVWDKLQIVMNSTTQSFILLSKTSKIRFFNQRAKSVIRLTQSIDVEEGMSIYEILPHETLNEFNSNFNEVLKGKKITIQRKITTKNQRVAWVEFHMIPVSEKTKTIEGVLVNAIDITTRKEAEEAHLESENKYRLLFQNMERAFLLINIEQCKGDILKGIVQETNLIFEKLLNIPAQHIRGKAVGEAFPHIHFNQDTIKEVNDKIFKHQPCQSVLSIRDLNKYLELQMYIPKKGYVAVLINDITDRRMTEKILKENESRYHTIISHIPYTDVFMFNHDLEFILARGTEMLKYGKEATDYEGVYFEDTLKTDQADLLKSYFQKTLKGQEGHDEVMINEKWHQIHTVPLRRENGEIYAGLYVSQNIHEKRKATEKIKQMNHEILQINQQLQASQKDLVVAQRNTKKIYKVTSNLAGDLNAQIKHALKTLLNIYDMDYATITKINGEIVTITACYSTESNTKLHVGAELKLENTYCNLVRIQNSVFSIHHVAESPYREHPSYKAFGYESYIGIPIHVDGTYYGSLSLTSKRSHVPFDQYKKELIMILGQWISGLLTRMGYEERLENTSLNLKKSKEELLNLNEELQINNENLESQRKKLELLNQELSAQRHALDTSVIVSITNREGVITYVNDKFCEISQYSRQELIGQNHSIVNSGHHSKDFFKNMWDTIINRPWQTEIKNKAKDGSFYWVYTAIVPFFNQKNEPKQFLSIHFDITKRKEAELALKASEEFLNTIQKESKIGGWVVDLRHKSIKWTKGVYTITEADAKEYQPHLKSNLEFCHPNDVHLLAKGFNDCIRKHKSFSKKVRCITKHQNEKWVKIVGHAEQKNNRTIRIWGVCMDITEQEDQLMQIEKALEKVHQSKLDKKILLDAIPDNMFRINEQGTYIGFKAKRGTTLLAPETIIGKTIHDLPFSHQVKTMLFQALQKTLATGKLQQVTYEVHDSKEGVSFYECRMVKSGDHEIIAIVRNITQQKKSEQQIQQITERLNLASQIAEIGIWEYYIENKKIICDDRMIELFHFDTKEDKYDGEMWIQYLPADELLRLKSIFTDAILKQEKRVQITFKIIRGDQSICHFEVMSEICYDTNHRAISVIGITRDMTKKVKNLEKIQEISERLQVATQSAKIGIWEYRYAENILIWDQLMYQMYGIDQQNKKLTYHTWLSTVVPSEQDVFHELVEKQIRDQEKKLETEFHIMHNHQLRSMKIYANIEYYENGSPKRIIGVSSDITKAREIERQIIKQNRELLTAEQEMRILNKALAESHSKMRDALEKEKSSTTTLEKTLAELKNTQTHLVQSEKMAGLGQLTAGIAHEINNPINFISGGVSALRQNYKELKAMILKYQEIGREAQNTQLVEKLHEFEEEIDIDFLIEETESLVSDIQMGAERTAEIVRGLRTFSRVNENSLKVTDLHENIDATLVILNNQLKHRITVEKKYDYSIPQVECFAGKINQVFMNIIVNAAHAIENQGTIQIITQKMDQHVMISIKDNGIGMSDTVKNRIFDPFFTTKPIGKGTGLGLSISHGIIQAHQGSITVESEPNQGSTFSIMLPIKHHKKTTDKKTIKQSNYTERRSEREF